MRMKRFAMQKLLDWKEDPHRLPLIIRGARQVGKTWLMKEFGKLYYTDTVYINFDSNSRMAELFASDLDTDRLIMGLELYVGHKIDPNNSLLVFDEVQEVPRALASLKYFYENAPQFHIVCAGSLLGIALHQVGDGQRGLLAGAFRIQLTGFGKEFCGLSRVFGHHLFFNDDIKMGNSSPQFFLF